MNVAFERALAIARGYIAPPGFEKSEHAPSGFQPVPGGKHGGYRKLAGGKWQYWYPHAEAVRQASAHHENQRLRHHAAAVVKRGRDEEADGHANAAERHGDIATTLRDYVEASDYIAPVSRTEANVRRNAQMDAAVSRVVVGGMPPVAAHKSFAQESDMNRIETALAIARGDILPAWADAMLAKSRVDREDVLVKAANSGKPPSGYTAADEKKRAAESAAMPEEAGEGKHYIAEGKDIKRSVDTVARHGLYAVHGGGQKDSLARNGTSNGKLNYSITHTPTGMLVGHESTKAGAIAHAKHFHEHAGDAGKDAKFGEAPGKEDMKRLQGAYEARAKKSMDDWRPLNATPDQLGIDISKGLSVPSADRGIVRPDAFAGIKPAQPRRGEGDVLLKGIGAGFDPRWNGESGFGE